MDDDGGAPALVPEYVGGNDAQPESGSGGSAGIDTGLNEFVSFSSLPGQSQPHRPA